MCVCVSVCVLCSMLRSAAWSVLGVLFPASHVAQRRIAENQNGGWGGGSGGGGGAPSGWGGGGGGGAPSPGCVFTESWETYKFALRDLLLDEFPQARTLT